MDAQPVLLLSYFFSPCNLTPTERVLSWAKYLQQSGVYPIIVTRNWDVPVRNATTDMYLSSGDAVRVEKKDGYEVHYIPYRAGFKDRLFLKTDGTRWYPIYLVVSMLFNLFNKYFLRLNPSFALCEYAENLIKERGLQKMVVTAPPFEFFGYAHRLHQRTGIRWIADYRDDWSTSDLEKGHAIKEMVKWFNRGAERRYLSSASQFTTVSPHYVNKIKAFIGKEGHLLSNGYMPENYRHDYPLYQKFTITYVGSIYPTQPIELFLRAFRTFMAQHQNADTVCLQWVGVDQEPAIKQRILAAFPEAPGVLQFTDRIPKAEAIERQARSHAVLACAHQGLKGIPGSKLYEYIALRKPVILYPSDGDILESTLLATQQGLVCHNEADCVGFLNQLYSAFKADNQASALPLNEIEIAAYSRKEITATLAKLLQGV
jgi:glycosyltransferase involved in cell wall biosynthesis